ncbi:MAG: NAD-dependent epimerase [Bdellovibrionales bacterium]|nr:NAD-dependent epimerase [Bdellovibrionales bacterium]
MKVFVTGVAGFIGNQLAKILLERGDEVFGVDNLNDYYDVSLKMSRLKRLENFENFRFEKIDIADKKTLEKTYTSFQPQRIAAIAAQAGVRYSLVNPNAYLDSNLAGFLNLLEISRHHGTEHLVFASSSSVYGANTKMPFSTHSPTEHPVSLYAATKKANEVMAHSYAHLFKIPMTGLRFFTVYGPWGRPDMATFLFTKAILEGKPIDVFNHGHHKRDFTYIDDIIEGVVRVIDHPAQPNPSWDSLVPDTASSTAPYRIYNIGCHQPILLSDFISTLEETIGKKAILNLKEMQPGDVPDTFADSSDLKKDFGYHPSTSLKEGLTAFYKWYKDYFKVNN